MADLSDPAERDDDAHSPGPPPRLALLSIGGFWLFYFVIVTLRGMLLGIGSLGETLGPRTLVALVGMALSYVIYRVLRACPSATLARSVVSAMLLSVPASILYSATNWYAFRSVNERMISEAAKTVIIHRDGAPVAVPKPPNEDDMWSTPTGRSHATPPVPVVPPVPPGGTTVIQVGGGDMSDSELPALPMIADSAVNGYFFFVAWAALYLALCFAAETRVAERRTARFRAAAQSAELRALRYQINPHFLFNTLNSLSSLVLVDRHEEAERMILNLSTFFRTSLTADPAEDLALAEELRLQELYLDIERVRFPERLVVDIAVPEKLRDACVPALILQPLIENAIKYGVSRSRVPVTIRIEAREDSGGLVLSVSDDAEACEGSDAHGGTGLGLRNVCDRIAARFGTAGSVRWGPRPDGGFIVTITMPVVRRDC